MKHPLARPGLLFLVCGLLVVEGAPPPPVAPEAAPRPRAAGGAALPAAMREQDIFAWAAHGSLVALASPAGVRVIDVSTGDELELPGTLGAPADLRFSPKGGRLAVSLRVGGKSDVYLLDVAARGGPRLYRLTLSGGGDPRWLGRGDRLIYQAPDGAGGFAIFVREEDGLGPARPFWGEEPAPQAPLTVTIS